MQKHSGNLTLLFLGCFVLSADAQIAEHRYWYFGFGAGLDMGTSPPTALSNGVLSTDEGVASIADASGQLLFYTNGERVWDRTHTVMPNGNGLHGHYSSSQAALIVPFPDDPQRFYVFTTPAMAGTYGGPDHLAWSVVDMAAHDGLGDVTTLNQPLVGPVVEKLTATRHANGRETWVVAHGWENDVYHAYLVTCGGVIGPVVSHVGRVIGLDPYGTASPAMGCMQFSAQGDRLAATWGEFIAPDNGNGHLDLLAFDNSTGVLTLLDTLTHAAPNWDIRGYGVCFSPNGERLYQSEYGLANGGALARIMQYTVSGNTLSGEVNVAEPSTQAYGTLQRAPDGTIYAARLNGAHFLSRITAPDAGGSTCGFVAQAVTLTAPSTWGLPNHWDAHPPIIPPAIALSDTTFCGSGTATLDATLWHVLHTPHYSWSTGDTTPAITVDQPGSYTVQAILGCDTVLADADIRSGGIDFDLGPDTLLCLDDSLILRIPDGTVSWAWSDGSVDSTVTVSAGNWNLTVIDSAGCFTSDERIVTTADCTCPVFVPNTFSPNGDGINDLFQPEQQCAIRGYALRLFDRWGREIWFTDDPTETWDGTIGGDASPTALYAWQLDLRYWDGTGERFRKLRGHVLVLK